MSCDAASDHIDFVFVLTGKLEQIFFPQRSKPLRTDGLWQTTCFEVFIASDDNAYMEFNFSPSGQWAAYQFQDYRDGMAPLPIEHPLDHPPTIIFWDEKCPEDVSPHAIGATCRTGIRQLAGKSIGLSAVIEEKDGTKSYWALRHPPGKPDFHHKDCFAIELPSRNAL